MNGWPEPHGAIDQRSAHVPGRNRAGDQFGTAIAVIPGPQTSRVLVGVPGKDVAGKRDAGELIEFTYDAVRAITLAGRATTMSAPASGARFGSAVAQNGRVTLVAAPMADRGAGRVVVIGTAGEAPTLPTIWRRTAGSPAAGDHYGSVLSSTTGLDY
jgi:hypothetical protein